jgi:hypothetical protein
VEFVVGGGGTCPQCLPIYVLEKRAKTEIDNFNLLSPQILGPSAVPLGYLRSHYEQDFSHLQCWFELRLLETLFILISLE